MKKYVLVIILALNIILASKGQDIKIDSNEYTIIYLPQFYKEKGVVFHKDYIVGIDIENMKSRFTPAIDDVEKAEEIFISNYNQHRGRNVDVKKEFWHYVRQYIGVVENNGNRKIIVQFIDNSRPGKIRRLLGKRWERNFVSMLADSFYEVSDIFSINIDSGGMNKKL